MDAMKLTVESWVKLHTREMYSYALIKVKAKEAAEDIVQNAFLAAWKAYPSFQQKSNPRTWLFSILKHKIADYYRIKFRQSSEIPSDITGKFFDKNDRWNSAYRPSEWQADKDLLDDPEFTNALKDCFEKLPEKWSSAVRLKYLEQDDAETICSMLEITKPNFWQIIHRAKLSLRNCLELKWIKNS